MRLTEPFPTLEELMHLVGEAGSRLAEIEASEGAAGNISLFIGWPVDYAAHFPAAEPFPLPLPAPELAGRGFLVTGSGRRLREIASHPAANLGYIVIGDDGRAGTLYTAPERLFDRPTSEFNSHLAVHRDAIQREGLNFNTVVHAQPRHLVYLSHIARYQDTLYLNRHILRWQPESIVNIPAGVGFLPFLMPGSPELMLVTVKALREHRIVLWGKHGVIVRSEQSVKKATDLIEYAETGAQYEYMNLLNHGLADGLTRSEIRQICDTLNLEQSIF